MTRVTWTPGLALGAAVAVVGLVLTGQARAGAPHPKLPSPAVRAATASARRALLRRSDLGVGWSAGSVAPSRAASLTCAADRSVLAGVASATWSQRSSGVFASGTSYGYSGGAAERRAWVRTASHRMGRCLESLLTNGSGHGVRLRATGVRRLAAPRLVPGTQGIAIRRYRVSGMASGSGQQTKVALDVVLLAAGTWIAEDEFSASEAPPAVAIEARIVGVQVRRNSESRAP